MPLFIDRHDVPGATPEDVAADHARDVEIQGRYGVRYTTYWHDQARGTVFCLVEAPNRDLVNAVHEEAHGNTAGAIIEVDGRAVQAFLGSIQEPETGEPWVATAFRAILFTDIEDSTRLTQQVGDAAAMRIVREHDELVRDALAATGGREVKHTGDGIMASFMSCGAAMEGAVRIQRTVAERNAGSDLPFRLRIGVSAGEPVTEGDDLFGSAVQLAARLCSECEPSTVLVSSGVRELLIGKGYVFVDLGRVELKGFEEPVAIYALHPGDDPQHRP